MKTDLSLYNIHIYYVHTCSECVYVLVLGHSVVSDSFFATPWIVACRDPLSMGILQARILEWIAVPFSRGSSQPRDQTQVSHTAGELSTI